ncbi:MAG: M24 family metallopeptidase [Bacillota bacterium]
MKDRLERTRKLMEKAELDLLLVLSQIHRYYLSGFYGTSGALIITSGRALLVTDFRYLKQAAGQAPGYELVKQEGMFLPSVINACKKLNPKRIGVESRHIAYADYAELNGAFGADHIVPCTFLEKMRMTKDDAERDMIGKALRTTEEAFMDFLGILKPGMTEKRAAAELEYRMRLKGAEGFAFETLIAGGNRSALPHWRASDAELKKGDLVIIDCGARLSGYNADLTRTVVLGRADERQKEIHGLVLKAQEECMSGLRAGMGTREADALARRVICTGGHGERFGHGTGHGVGLEIHEEPHLSPVTEDRPLPAGTVVTVEPGVYVSGWGGVRIEDMAVIGEEGAFSLNSIPRDLWEI